MKLKITKKRNVKTPSRGTARSAGLDFYVPAFDTDYLKYVAEKNATHLTNGQLHIDYAAKQILIAPGANILLPSGIRVNLPSLADGTGLLDEQNGIAFIAFNKSGVSVKLSLDVGASVVDEDYQHELHIHVKNDSNRMVTLDEGRKLVQFIAIPVLLPEVEVVEHGELFTSCTARTGAFGSTGEY